MSIDHLLNRKAQVLRPTRVSNGQGGWAEKLEALGGDPINIRVRPARAAEREQGDQASARVTHIVYTRADSGVARGDVLEVQGTTTAEGAALELEVVAVREPSKAGHHLEVDAFSRQPAEAGGTSSAVGS